jgi:hypothetical protein
MATCRSVRHEEKSLTYSRTQIQKKARVYTEREDLIRALSDFVAAYCISRRIQDGQSSVKAPQSSRVSSCIRAYSVLSRAESRRSNLHQLEAPHRLNGNRSCPVSLLPGTRYERHHAQLAAMQSTRDQRSEKGQLKAFGGLRLPLLTFVIQTHHHDLCPLRNNYAHINAT